METNTSPTASQSSLSIPLPVPLTATGAGEQIDKLKIALIAAEEVAKLLLGDPHFRNCPFVAAIRGPVSAGLERMEGLANWLEGNPITTGKPVE